MGSFDVTIQRSQDAGRQKMPTDECVDHDEQWFEDDLLYLQTILPDPKKIEGIILKLRGDERGDYGESLVCFKNIKALNTLRLEGPAPDYDSILVFKQCEEQLKLRPSGRLQVLSHYSFTQGSAIMRKNEIAELPKPLKDLLVKDDFKNAYNWLVDDMRAHVSSDEADGFSHSDEDPNDDVKSDNFSEEEHDDEIARMKRRLRELEGRIEKLERRSPKEIGKKSKQKVTYHVNDFLRRHFKKGGMIPLKDARKKSGWMREYAEQLETKTVHMCKSCGKKSNRGCCSKYRPSNRTTTQMIVGWSAN
jgi:hypothetical protein